MWIELCDEDIEISIADNYFSVDPNLQSSIFGAKC